MSRKHIQQMNGLERSFIHGYIRTQALTGKVNGVGHFEDRASERHFTLADAVSTLRSGLVVEVHNDKQPSLRALVRDSKGTCVVVELQSMRVITVYYNDPEDKHETLNWNLYRWNQDIMELVKSIRKVAA
jgi:exonuclease III